MFCVSFDVLDPLISLISITTGHQHSGNVVVVVVVVVAFSGNGSKNAPILLVLHVQASARQPDGMLLQLRLSPSVYFKSYFEQSASVVQSLEFHLQPEDDP
jgi:hypothetical protein